MLVGIKDFKFANIDPGVLLACAWNQRCTYMMAMIRMAAYNKYFFVKLEH